jgi:hypothetical protein
MRFSARHESVFVRPVQAAPVVNVFSVQITPALGALGPDPGDKGQNSIIAGKALRTRNKLHDPETAFEEMRTQAILVRTSLPRPGLLS